MKILIAPDSYKGSLSAIKFCEICASAIKKVMPDAQIDLMPLADGGEGTLNCIEYALKDKPGAIKINECYVQNSLYEDTLARVGFIENGRTAIVETALSNGLPLIKGQENPEETSTYGVGQMVAFAVDHGAKNVILALGGSSTNDCGLGLMAALGGCFYNAQGISFVPTGGTLKEVQEIDLSMMYPRLGAARFEAMCDVKNPLYGPNGASYVFGPQKGADPQMVQRLDEGCKWIASLFNKMKKTDFALEEGAGAAGGLGFAVLAGLNGKLKSGIDSVLEICNFSDRVKDCDLIITGEGAFDSQSLMGKTVGGLLNHTTKTPVVVFCGKTDGTTHARLKDIIAISENQDLDYALTHAKENLEKAVTEYFKKM